MLNTIVSIAALAAVIAVCVAVHIRYKRRSEACERAIDTCKQETKKAQIDAKKALDDATKMKADTEAMIQEYHSLTQSGLRIIKHKKQKDIYNITYEAIRKFIHTDSIGIGILNGLFNSLDFSFFNMESETIPFARYNLDICNNINIYCFAHGKMVLINDYQKEVSQYIDTEKYKVSKSVTGSALYIPLYDDDIIFGVLSIFNNEPYYFNERRIEIVRSIVSYLETAIVNFSTARTSEGWKKRPTTADRRVHASNGSLTWRYSPTSISRWNTIRTP